jgi:cyclopropane fatty-acyl-phospholipid synthase-like methyltransferase
MSGALCSSAMDRGRPAKRHAPATERNRAPILAVLARVLAKGGDVLEVASGSGEHAIWFAGALPEIVWQPTDVDPEARASIDAWAAEAGLANVRRALALDATADAWPVARVDAVVCINMIHIAPVEACEGLLRGASRVLEAGEALFLYGPFKLRGEHTAESNARFDLDLRARDPSWGVRDLDDVLLCAETHGLVHEETVAMPANNLSVVLRKR